MDEPRGSRASKSYLIVKPFNQGGIIMYVSLFGWQSAREIIEFEGLLFFQVALHGHCDICQSRIDHIKSVVARKELQVKYGHSLDSFPRDRSYMWVGIQKPKSFMEEREKKDFIKSTFDLPIE